ncbi:MAG TPA: DUF4395 domain-containing protein [Jiangellales bacterium]|nr:DUF4395 domain-containing protein [Jiangellales bacterium]
MIDPRGQRFAAAVTTVVLAAVLLLDSPALLALQAVAFGLAVALGPARSPYGVVYARLVRPRIGPPAELEDARPPRFAQTVGLGFALAGLLAYAVGAPAAAAVAVGGALAAAFLNAAFGICLGCELYLTYRRIVARETPALAAVRPDVRTDIEAKEVSA